MTLQNIEDSNFNPEKNNKAVSIIEQSDGNWIGYMYKFGTIVSARQSDPQVVLQLLLTHDGKEGERTSQ